MASTLPAEATQAILKETLILTPVRRRYKRPSFSPVKTPRREPTLLHRSSVTFMPGQVFQMSPQPAVSVSTAALEFEEFSYWDKDGFLTGDNISDAERLALRTFLLKHYNATDLFECFPFLVIGCKGGPPSEEQRPFTIAGAIAIWKDAEDLNFKPLIGDLGQGDDIGIDPAMANKILPLEVPSQEVILYLANDVFPECKAISVLWEMLVIELPATSKEEHLIRLQNLPCDIQNCPLILRFYNGPLPNSERRRRAVQPMPRLLESAVCDETDYVKQDGRFYPGTMISSVAKTGDIYGSATAGILVEKGDQQRLTCSFHCWEAHFNKYPDRFGKTDTDAMDTFKVVQGHNPGSAIGFVRERMGESDIALTQLHDGVVFENKFMEMDAAPKIFLRSNEQNIGDLYVLDSFVTGKQKVSGFGCRFTMGWSRSHPTLVVPEGGRDKMPIDGVKYIALEQGAYITNSPEIIGTPQIRDSVCGSVLLRCKSAKCKRTGQGKTAQDHLKLGEIGGMVHFCDLQMKYSSKAENYIMYADSFDPLIDAGWTIVQQPEDNDEETDEGVAAHQEEEGSPSKKQKIGE